MGSLIPINQSLRNPASNWQVNPARNWQINPARNWQINPARNWQINPARNWQINPARNWQINPARNWQVNPTRNWQINPLRNQMVDPRRIIQLAPDRSSVFPGFYVCSVADFYCYYFTVKTPSQDVLLIYDSQKSFCFFAVGIMGCYAIFSVNDYSYTGILCPNGEGKFNWFSLNGEWLYFFT